MKYINKTNILLSILFSLFTIIGESYKLMDSWDYILHNPVRTIGLFLLYIIIYYVILLFLDKILNKVAIKKKGSKITQLIFDKKPFLFPFLFILLFWLPFIIIKYPGTPGWDFYHFLNNYYMFDEGLTNHFPIVYVFTCVYFIKFGIWIHNVNMGLFLLTIFHMLFMLISFSITFYYLKKWSINYKYRWFLLLFFSLNPLFANYSTTLYHDIISSSLLLIYTLILTDFILETVNTKKLLIFSVISLLICLSKKNGIYIITPINIYIIFKYIKNTTNFKMFKIFLLLVPTIIFLVIHYISSHWYYSKGVLEAISIPIQNIARYSRDYHDDISNKDLENINGLLDYNLAGKLYNPTLVDTARNEAGNYFYTTDQVINFLKSWIHLFFKHPTCYIQSFINNTYQLYYPFEKTTYLFFEVKEESNYRTIIDFENPKKFINIKNTLKQKTNEFQNIPIIGCIDDPGIYIWLLIYLFTKIKKKNKLPVIPSIFIFLMCLTGPTIDYNSRYTFPIIFSVFPLLAFYQYISKKVILKNAFK